MSPEHKILSEEVLTTLHLLGSLTVIHSGCSSQEQAEQGPPRRRGLAKACAISRQQCRKLIRAVSLGVEVLGQQIVKLFFKRFFMIIHDAVMIPEHIDGSQRRHTVVLLNTRKQ